MNQPIQFLPCICEQPNSHLTFLLPWDGNSLTIRSTPIVIFEEIYLIVKTHTKELVSWTYCAKSLVNFFNTSGSATLNDYQVKIGDSERVQKENFNTIFELLGAYDSFKKLNPENTAAIESIELCLSEKIVSQAINDQVLHGSSALPALLKKSVTKNTEQLINELLINYWHRYDVNFRE